MDALSEGYDTEVLKWKEDVQNRKTFCAYYDGVCLTSSRCACYYFLLHAGKPCSCCTCRESCTSLQDSDFCYPFTPSPLSIPGSPTGGDTGSGSPDWCDSDTGFMNSSTIPSPLKEIVDQDGEATVNAHAVLPLPSYFSVTQGEMEKRFGIYKGHSPGS